MRLWNHHKAVSETVAVSLKGYSENIGKILNFQIHTFEFHRATFLYNNQNLLISFILEEDIWKIPNFPGNSSKQMKGFTNK